MPPSELINVNGRQLILARALVQQRPDLLTNEETSLELAKNPRRFTSFLARNAYEFVCNGRITAKVSTNASIYIYLDAVESIKGKAILATDGKRRQAAADSSGRRTKKTKIVEEIENNMVVADDVTQFTGDAIETVLKPLENSKNSGYETICLDNVSVQIRKSDGFVNATKLCKDARNGKEWKAFIRLNRSQKIIEELSSTLKIATERLITYQHAGPYEFRGTFVHPQLTSHLANWIGTKENPAVAALPSINEARNVVLAEETVYQITVTEPDDVPAHHNTTPNGEDLHTMTDDRNAMLIEEITADSPSVTEHPAVFVTTDREANASPHADETIVRLDDSEEVDHVDANDMSALHGYRTLSCDDQSIEFREFDGYVNATKLCKDGNKNWSDYCRNATTIKHTKKLCEELSLSTSALIKIQLTGTNDTRGTWIHPRLLPHLRHWIAAKPTDRDSSGFVYLATCPYYDAVKIGMWRGSIEGLRQRYKTLLGADLWMAYVSVADAKSVETNMHETFASQSIDGGERFSKNSLEEYVQKLRTYGTLGVDEAKVVAQSEPSSASAEAYGEPIDDTVAENNAIIEAEPIDLASAYQSLQFHDLSIQIRKSDGYVNATKLCKDGGKQWAHYHENKTTAAFKNELSKSLGKSSDMLIDQIRTGPNATRGTFVHPHVAINLAQWISPRFAVAVSTLVIRYSRGEVTTEESQLFAENLAQSTEPTMPTMTPHEQGSINETGVNQHLLDSLTIESLKKDLAHANELSLCKLDLYGSKAILDQRVFQAEMELQQAKADIALKDAQVNLEILTCKHKLEIQDLKFHLEAATVSAEHNTKASTASTAIQRLRFEKFAQEKIVQLKLDHSEREKLLNTQTYMAEARIADLTLSRERAQHAADSAKRDCEFMCALYKLRTKEAN